MQNPNSLFSLMPMIIMTIPLIILNYSTAGRKGKSQGLYMFLGFIPLINMFSFLYLVSITDKEVLDKIDLILNRLSD